LVTEKPDGIDRWALLFQKKKRHSGICPSSYRHSGIRPQADIRNPRRYDFQFARAQSWIPAHGPE
jgi:hypothetical protein